MNPQTLEQSKYERTKASSILSRVLPGTRGRIRFKAPRPAYTFLQVAFSWEYLPNAWSISIPSCYTLYSLSVYSLAKSLQLILESSANYRLVSYLLVDNWLICRLRAQCMISNIDSGSLRRCVSLFSSNQCITKQLLDILNNQGLDKCYQPRPSARLITLTSTLIIKYIHITKTSSNNCLISVGSRPSLLPAINSEFKSSF